METLLINFDRKENVIPSPSKCSSSPTGSTLIPEPLISVGSSTSVNLISGSSTAIINLNTNNQQHNLTNKEVTSSSNSNGYHSIGKSVSLDSSESTSTINEDDQHCAMITSESSSSSSTSIKSYINTSTTTTHNTRNSINGLNSSRGCSSATTTPTKSINLGQSLSNYSNNLLSSCPSVGLSPPTTTEIDRVNSYPPSMVSEHLSVISSSTFLNDHDVDSGPKSLPTYSSSTLSSPTTSSTSSSSSSFMISKGDRESLYSGSGSIDDGLLTQNGSIVWDRESDWILLFDEMLKLKGTNRQGSEDCICRRKYSDSLRLKASQGISASPSQSISSTVSSLSTYNDTDTMNSSKSSPLKRAASLPPSRRGVSPNIRLASQLAAHSPGAADEEMFIKSFEDVPMVHFASIKELEDELTRIRDWLGEKNTDWTKRIDGLKRLRSVLMSNSIGMKEFLEWFRGLELSFIPCVKDLRSQVVRETCFTIAYVSQKLGLKATRFSEMLLPILISLIPNSAKIMSSSATVAIRFVIQYTRSPRLIPIIAYNMNSKSKEIRKACCEFLDQILHTWSTSCLEKHGIALQEAIKKGISDADPEARQFARKAFWGFADHFRESADALLQSLDPSKQRILHGEAFAQQQSIASNLNRNSGRGSTGSLSQVDGQYNSKLPTFLIPSSLTTPSIRKVSTGSLGSSSSSQNCSNHAKVPVITNRSSIHNSPTTEVTSRSLINANQPTSYLPRIRCTLNKYPASTSLSSSLSSSTSSSSPSPGSYLNCGSTLRSTSAIDADAARRARTRAAAISSTIKPRVSSLANGSNDNARRKVSTPSAPVVANKSRDSGRYVTSSADVRQRYPVRASQSQPSSRSASPLSRSFTNGSSVPPSPSKTIESESRSSLRNRRNSGIPVSTNSRETSPNRNSKLPSNGLSTSFTNGSNGTSHNNKYNGHSNGHFQFNRSLSSDSYNLSEKLLQSSKEAEANMANTLRNFNSVQRGRFTNNNHDDGHSDAESDTSSVCSDLSFAARNIEEVSDIISNLSSSQWMDRKEGLLDLNLFLQLGARSLNQFELKRITDVFNKMLMDPHIKNHSLLFKVLNNLITSHKNHLYDWLYLLMTRLFIKIGSTTLASLSNKVNGTLDTIFVTFPVDNQFGCLARFLSDQSQTLNEKSKLSLLSYFNRLIGKMVPVDCYSPDKHDLQLSLMKIISWTTDPKSSELRRLSKEALLNLFTLNRQRIYTIVYQLPKTYQDAAFTLIHSRKRPSDDKSCFTSSAVLAPSASLLQDSSMFMSLNIRNGSTFESAFDESDNLNPDEIYHSLLRTTDEIQKYKFTGQDDDLIDDRLTSSLISYNRKSSSLASAPSSSPSSPSSSSSKAPSTSSASSSSPSSTTKLTKINNNLNLPHVVVASPNLITNGPKSKSTLSSSLKSTEIPKDKRITSTNNLINGHHHHRQSLNNNIIINNNNNLPDGKKFVKNHLTTPLTVDTKVHPNHHSTPIVLRSEDTSFNRGNQSTFSIANGHLHHHQYHHSNEYSSPSTKTGHETVTSNLISSLKNGHSKDNDYQKYALNELIELIKDSQLDLSRHFRDMLKILLDKLADEGNPTVRQLALRILRELLLKQPALFNDYTELTVLRILSASKDQDKEVQRISDLVSATAATVLPADSCLKILKSAMNSGDGAISQAAIKMLSKFIERQNEDQIESLLPDIMPSLIQACDNRESSIRKSAIFTLVAIHNRIGDRLNPHIVNLNGSKLKLLKLYIERAQASGSNGTEFSFS